MKRSSTTPSGKSNAGVKNAWWKIATIVLLVYTFTAGLMIRLQPSLTGVSSSSLHKGDNAVDVYYYNGNIAKQDKIEAWLFSGKNIICSGHINVKHPQVLTLNLHVPDTFNTRSLGLVLRVNGLRDTLFNAFQLQEDVVINKDYVAKNCLVNMPGKFKAGQSGFPNREVLNETIRNLFFHVPIWFAMMLAAFMGMFNGIRYLRTGKADYDIRAEKYLKTSVLMGILGLLTGSLWARFTWGTWWQFDVKLNGAAITVLIYLAYLVLRSSIQDEIQRARISAVYSIFAFVMMIVFVMVVPRIYDSLHPGNGGNPAFSNYDLDSTMRMVFYPAVTGWMGLALWITELNIRFQRIVNKEHENI